MARRGLARSRAQAATLVENGRVLVAGAVAAKPSRWVLPGESLEILPAPGKTFVSRGGLKLEAALERFALDVNGRLCLDAGASTGGFTDCLLKAGAAHVVAVDVGYGQLDMRLARDPKVTVLERTNVRHLDLAMAGGTPFGVVVADLSFISLRAVGAVLVRELAAPGANMVLLVKPQFEVGRVEASRGRGVVSDPSLHRRVLDETLRSYSDVGAEVMGLMPSPVRGAKGNVEYLAWLRVPGSPGSQADSPDIPGSQAPTPGRSGGIPVLPLGALVEEALEEAGRLR